VRAFPLDRSRAYILALVPAYQAGVPIVSPGWVRVLPPAGGCKTVGTTPSVAFRAVIEADGEVEMEVAP
jgi:hypothetical protein